MPIQFTPTGPGRGSKELSGWAGNKQSKQGYESAVAAVGQGISQLLTADGTVHKEDECRGHINDRNGKLEKDNGSLLAAFFNLFTGGGALYAPPTRESAPVDTTQ